MKVRHWSNDEVRDMSVAEIIDYEVSSASSERGQLEDLEARIRLLTDFIGRISSVLTPAQQLEIVKNAFYWRPVK